jgi:hypothetical protein
VDDLDLRKVHSAQSSQRQGQDIWLWHYQLGHPSFSYLQHLFPTIFENVLLSSFKYKDCILVKVIEQIIPSVIINVMHHLRLFTLTYGALHLL